MKVKNLPKHVGIIMGGNHRWAATHGVSHDEVRTKGMKRSIDIINASLEAGIQVLTLYTFSVESWQSSRTEAHKIFKILENYLIHDLAPVIQKGVKVRAIGSREGYSLAVNNLIEHAEKASAQNSSLVFNMSLSYGGKSEIVRACNRALQDSVEPGKFTEELLEKNLDTAGCPPIDLLIRTGGEMRISNFLLWQSAYTELFFSRVLWPDFGPEAMDEAIADYRSRERRFGLTGEQLRQKSA